MKGGEQGGQTVRWTRRSKASSSFISSPWLSCSEYIRPAAANKRRRLVFRLPLHARSPMVLQPLLLSTTAGLMRRAATGTAGGGARCIGRPCCSPLLGPVKPLLFLWVVCQTLQRHCFFLGLYAKRCKPNAFLFALYAKCCKTNSFSCGYYDFQATKLTHHTAAMG